MKNICDYDVIVVGAGLAGSIYANFFAKKNKKVLVVEKRDHIAGNLYDYNENGIFVQKYGPHCFHTNDEKVMNFINIYSDWYSYKVNCEVYMHNQYTPSPFNFKTIDQFYPSKEAKTIKEKLLQNYPGQKSVTILELLKSSDETIRKYADFLYKSDYSLYTAKQWGIKPEMVDPNVLRRVPVLLNYDEQYFYDKYQLMPTNGFTQFVQNILQNDNIDIRLNCDFLEHIKFDIDSIFIDGVLYEGLIVYTGELDRLFNYKFGELPYRSLRFEFFNKNTKSIQSAPIVAYPEATDFTRITEFSKFTKNVFDYTSYSVEYPQPYNKNLNEPYYPINNEKSDKIYNSYLELSRKYTNIILAGRLADFKYYNMDQVIKKVLDDIDILEVKLCQKFQ